MGSPPITLCGALERPQPQNEQQTGGPPHTGVLHQVRVRTERVAQVRYCAVKHNQRGWLGPVSDEAAAREAQEGAVVQRICAGVVHHRRKEQSGVLQDAPWVHLCARLDLALSLVVTQEPKNGTGTAVGPALAFELLCVWNPWETFLKIGH